MIRVLAVEDNQLLRKALTRVLVRRVPLLTTRKITVEVVEKLEEAWKYLATLAPEDQICLLTDQDLPDGKGLSFVAECQDRFGSRLVHVCLYTGDLKESIAQEARRLGIGFLRKPINVVDDYAPMLQAALETL
jgi:CheY-like chemotaxis protein